MPASRHAVCDRTIQRSVSPPSRGKTLRGRPHLPRRTPTTEANPAIPINAPSSERFRKRRRLLGGFKHDTTPSRHRGPQSQSTKQLLGGFVGNAGLSAKADLGLFRAPTEICPENRTELQTHVKISPVFLQNRPELQGRGKYRATAAQTTQNSKAMAMPWEVGEPNEAGSPKGCRPHVMPFTIAKSNAASRRPHAAKPRTGEAPAQPRRSPARASAPPPYAGAPYSAISMWGWGASARSATVTPST